MRTFNPEKELNKIQKGNKNKVIISVIALLLIVAIGSSYALYQIKYNKRIIYTTVDKFYSKDLQISVYVNGKEVEEFPDKSEEYSYSGYECENDSTVTFDHNDWTAQIKSTGPDKCKINFGNKNNFYDTLIASEDVLTDETKDGNLRYIGPNPENFIWFNCDDYNFTTTEEAALKNCERWRIIGIMNNMTIVDEVTGKETNNQNLVKIRNNNDIGGLAWDNSKIIPTSPTLWSQSQLMKLLNLGYENEDIGGSLYYNWEKRKNPEQEQYCYGTKSNIENATVVCDFSTTGIKNDETRNKIELVKWSIGKSSTQEYNQMYIDERYINGNNNEYWIGRIGLMYPSDYLYGTNGGELGREKCLNGFYATHWDRAGGDEALEYFNNCSNNSWLKYTDTTFDNIGTVHYRWTMLLYGNNTSARGVSSYGNIGGYLYWDGGLTVIPTLYLKVNSKIAGGEGTYEEPFILIP